MAIKDEKQLESLLMKKCQSALLKTQEEVYIIIRKFLDKFYDEYPTEDVKLVYHRTEKFLNSLVKSKIIPDGKGYKAEVYFNLNYIYESGSNPSGEQVMQAAEWGRHGAMGLAVADFKGTSVWHEPLEILNAEAINILVKMLKSEGIPIK